MINRPEANKILGDAIDESFEWVIVFGYKDDKIYSKYNEPKNILEIIGALEEAKRGLLERTFISKPK